MRRYLKYKIAALMDLIVRALPRSARPERLPPGTAQNDFTSASFLLVVLDNLGDAVMATVVPEAIKTIYPDARIDVVTRPANSDIFTYNPYVHEIFTDEAPWWSSRPIRGCLRPGYWRGLSKNLSVLRRRKYNAVIDLRGDLRHLIIFGIAINPKFLFGYHRTGGRNLLSIDTVYERDTHEIDKKLKLLEHVGVKGIRPHAKMWLLPDELAWGRDIVTERLGSIRSPTILIDPGGKAVQRWPLERFGNLARSLFRQFHVPFLVSGGPAYSDLAEKLARMEGPSVLRLVGAVSLRELASVIAACDLTISADTGICHIASAVGTPAVTLFGPTDPKRFWHGVEAGQILKSSEALCRAVLHKSCCKPGHSAPGACMFSIGEEIVVAAVLKALKRSDIIHWY